MTGAGIAVTSFAANCWIDWPKKTTNNVTWLSWRLSKLSFFL